MQQALIKESNKLISIDVFKRQYGEQALREGLKLICPACKNELYTYGLVSLKREARFQHNPGTSCIYVDDRGEYLAAPNGWDIENGKYLRLALEDKEFISKLYCFCLTLCRNGNLPVNKFIELVQRADRRNLWSHSGLKEWLVGFLLLVLDDFQGGAKEDKKYIFRFFLKKNIKDLKNLPPKSGTKIKIEDLIENEDYYLVKVFDNGNLMKLPEGNPYNVNRVNWEKFSKNYEWVMSNQGDRLIQKIKDLRK